MCALVWWTSACMLLQSKRLTLFALRTVGHLRRTTLSFQHTAAVAALGTLLIGRGLNADVNLVLVDEEGRLFVTDFAVKSFEFQVAAVYAPNIVAERVFFFQQLVPFLDNLKRTVFVGDWNVILDSNIDSVGRGAKGPGSSENCLIDFMGRHDFVDRFRLDHPGRKMWMWLHSSPSVRSRSYLDRVLIRRADTILLSVPRSTV